MRKITITNKHRKAICYCILAITFILMCNTNNNPEAFIVRIIKPIKTQNGIYYLGGVVTLLTTYYTLKYINLIQEKKLIKTRLRRVIVTIILGNIVSIVAIYPTQFLKGVSKDLNSIYLYRDNSSVVFQGDKTCEKINGLIKVKNCGNNLQEFYIKVKVPASVKSKLGKEYVDIESKYSLKPNEVKEINIYQQLSSADKINNINSYSDNAFEYILYNENDEVIFKGTQTDYHLDSIWEERF